MKRFPREDGKKSRFPRFRIRHVAGAMTISHEVEVLNLSMGEALVEHRGMVRVGVVCFLALETDLDSLTIRCRVVHSRVSLRDQDGSMYWLSGMEFFDLTPEAEQALEAVIRSYGARKDDHERPGP